MNNTTLGCPENLISRAARLISLVAMPEIAATAKANILFPVLPVWFEYYAEPDVGKHGRLYEV